MAVHPPQTFRDFPDNPVSNYGKNIIDNFQTKICQDVANIPKIPLYLPLSFRDVLNKVGGGHLHSPPNDAPSCIIPVPTDAKVGGLYAAKLLEEHDCYAVGAMRFPDIPIMKPLFELFRALLYNEVLVQRTSADPDPKKFDVIGIPPDYRQLGLTALMDNVLGLFVKRLADDCYKKQITGWALMAYDMYSTRTYMSGKRSDTRKCLDELQQMPYSTKVVNWLDIYRLYQLARQGIVRNSSGESGFRSPGSGKASKGGSEVITKKLSENLQNKPILHMCVNAISYIKDSSDHKGPGTGVRLHLVNGQSRMYARVINTTALPCLRTTDLAAAELDSDQSTALSELQYGSTTKIRVKFKTAWWGEAAVMKELGGCGAIVGGQSFTDRMVRTVVYPSYGVDSGRQFTVLTVSYARTADASRWHPLLREESEEQLKEIVLRDLAAVHGFDPVKEVESTSGTPCMELGAFGFFGLGQFAEVIKHLGRPTAGGRLHFAGEGVRWAVGALEASRRAVQEIVLCSCPDKWVKSETTSGEKEVIWTDERIMFQIAVFICELEAVYVHHLH
ncbi:hypothetical protein AcW1_004020 [Taiwanofungus camphoratus]|nr:hypothetical protein AcW1_004020 [Antrodia cinnamomea]